MPTFESSKEPRILVAIPCYNEQNSVGELVETLRTCLPCDTLVIDDASQDRTFAVASRVSACIRLPVNLGIGGAVQTAIKYAERNGYDLCIQVDGDGQHPPSQVRRLVDAYKKQPANLIIGSRFLTRGGFRSTAMRRSGITMISAVLRFFFNARITDPTSGFRLMDRKAIELFSQHYPTDFPEPISTAMAIRLGLEVREISVEMASRTHGQSSIMGFKTVAYMIRVLCYVALMRFVKGETQK